MGPGRNPEDRFSHVAAHMFIALQKSYDRFKEQVLQLLICTHHKFIEEILLITMFFVKQVEINSRTYKIPDNIVFSTPLLEAKVNGSTRLLQVCCKLPLNRITVFTDF